MSFSFGTPSGQTQNQTMVTPATSTARRSDQEGQRYVMYSYEGAHSDINSSANCIEKVSIKTDDTHTFTLCKWILLQESDFFKQQEEVLVANKPYELPAPHTTGAFEVFIEYISATEVPKSIGVDRCIDAYKLGKFLKAERFTEQCRKIAESRMFLKFPHPTLSQLCKLAGLTDDPLKTLIIDRIANLIIDGIYASPQEAISIDTELSANETPESVWKELLKSIILQARRRSEGQPALYGHNNRGPGFATAIVSSDSTSANRTSFAQGPLGNNDSSTPAGGMSRPEGGIFGNQPPGSNTTPNISGTLNGRPQPGGLFGQASNNSLFGHNSTQNKTGGLFGSRSTPQTAESHACKKGLFEPHCHCATCDRENKSSSGSGPFGTTNIIVQQSSGTSGGTSGGLFGNNSRPLQQSGSLFGAANNKTNQIVSGGGMFGQALPSSGSVFGVHTSSSGGAFGKPAQPHSLFGAPQTSRYSGGLFGQTQPTTNTLGSLSAQQPKPQQANNTGGLFGNNNATTGGFTSHGSKNAGFRGTFSGFETSQVSGLVPPSSGGCGRPGCFATNRCHAFGCAPNIEPAGLAGAGLSFPVHIEIENGSRIVAYQSIVATPAYHRLSHEELRLQHYLGGSQGQKVPDTTSGTGLVSVPNSDPSNHVTDKTHHNNKNVQHHAEVVSKETEIEGLQARIAHLELASARREKEPATNSASVDSSISKGKSNPDLEQNVHDLQIRFDIYAKQQADIMTMLNAVLENLASSPAKTPTPNATTPKAEKVTCKDIKSANVSGMSTPEVVFTPTSSTNTSPDVPKATVQASKGKDHDDQTINTKEKENTDESCSDDPISGRDFQDRLSTDAKTLYKYLKVRSMFTDGLHAEDIARDMNLQFDDVCQAAKELVENGLVFTTVNEYSWAALDF